jgi:UDP-galactopyranose mutase
MRSWAAKAFAHFTAWFYTPMALPFAGHLEPELTVYDCMDELSAFAGAPADLGALERQLFNRSDIVFTGGHSLFRGEAAISRRNPRHPEQR